MSWFYAENGASCGPVTEQALLDLLRSGTITASTAVWTQGAPGWQPFGQTALVSRLANPSAPPTPPPLPVAPLAPAPAVPVSRPPPVLPSPLSPSGSSVGGIVPLTVQSGNAARSSFSSFFELVGIHPPAEGGSAQPDAGLKGLTGVNFWAARMGETTLGGLVGRGLPPKDFEWLMPLETVALGDGRTVGPAYVGVTGDGRLHVFFHIKGEGFYYAGMPVAVATVRWELAGPGLRGTLSFPPATGLKQAIGEALRPDWLVGLNAAWLRFWQPAIFQGWANDGGNGAGATTSEAAALAMGQLTVFALAKGGFGLEVMEEEAAVFFRPTPGGELAFWPKNMLADDPVESWHLGMDGRLEVVRRPEQDLPYLLRLEEHVLADDEARLPRWSVALNFGAPASARVETPPSEALRMQGQFTTLWEDAGRAVYERVRREGDTLVTNDLSGPGGDQALDRGGFVLGKHAVAATAAGRCVRLELADPHVLDAVPRFAPGAVARLEPWCDDAKSLGCAVFIQPAGEADPAKSVPLPACFTLGNDRFSVGPLRDVPLRGEDRIEHEERPDGSATLRLVPAADPAAPGQPAPAPVTLLLPAQLALRLWEEWDVAHTRAALARANVGGFYREFNETKKFNLLAVLFSDVVLLNQALDRGIPMADLLTRLGGEEGDDGREPLRTDAGLRKEVVAKIVALVQMLPGIKQKLELMASMYPYFWVNQEVEWLRAAFGPQAAASQEAALRKRSVPLVRREVRNAQGNLGRALGEIEAAARPIDALLSRQGINQTWTAQARRYLPLAAQGASALTMLALSHGMMGWAGLATFMASGVAGSALQNISQDAESIDQIGRAARTIFPWWRVFLHALVTTQWEFSQFVDEENALAMKRDRALLDQVPAAGREAATARLAAALRERIVTERRNRFAEVLAGSGVRFGSVVNDIEKAVRTSARDDVAEFVQMFSPVRASPPPVTPPPPTSPTS